MTLPSQAHSLHGFTPQIGVMIYPPHIIPPSLPNGHQNKFGLVHLENTSPRTEVPLVVPEMPSPNIPTRETRLLGFG